MAHVLATDLVVDFPIYSVRKRSLKSTFLNTSTGGRLAGDVRDHIVIRALNGVSFEFREGDRIGIVGHNGSGKTTLLRVLVGAYEPVRGSITTVGRVASMLSIMVGMDMEATGYDNIFVRTAIMGMSRKETTPLVEEICEFSGLGDYIDMPMRTYSSGMAMRLAFSIATSIAADIVVMDEWLSAGDQDFSDKAQSRLTRLIDQAKILVLASHDGQLIRKNCNKIMHLEHGDLVKFAAI